MALYDVNKTDDFDRNEVTLGDKDSPDNKAKVDQHGNQYNKISFQDDGTLVGTNLPTFTFPITVFEHFYKSDIGTRIWSESTSNGGSSSFNTTHKVADITVPTTSGAYVYRQTRTRFRYYPGRAVHASMTVNLNGTQTNIRKRVGYFDVNDGMFLEVNGDTFNFVIRTSSSGTPANLVSLSRDQWTDPLDGTGPSGKAIDFTKTVFVIFEFLWQGAGYVKMSFLDGREKVVAVDRKFFGATDGLTTSFMANPTLPFRIELENTGTSAGTTIKHICTSLSVYNDNNLEGIPVGLNNGIGGRTGNDILLLGFRVRSTTPTRNIAFVNADAFIGGNNTAYINVILNPTLTNDTWTNSGSASEYTIDADYSGGTLLASKIVRGNSPISLEDIADEVSKILGESIDGTKDIVAIVMRSFSGNITGQCTVQLEEY